MCVCGCQRLVGCVGLRLVCVGVSKSSVVLDDLKASEQVRIVLNNRKRSKPVLFCSLAPTHHTSLPHPNTPTSFQHSHKPSTHTTFDTNTHKPSTPTHTLQSSNTKPYKPQYLQTPHILLQKAAICIHYLKASPHKRFHSPIIINPTYMYQPCQQYSNTTYKHSLTIKHTIHNSSMTRVRIQTGNSTRASIRTYLEIM